MIFLLCCDDISRHPHPQIPWTFCLDNGLWIASLSPHSTCSTDLWPALVVQIWVSFLFLLFVFRHSRYFFPHPHALMSYLIVSSASLLGLLVDVMSLFYSICVESFVLSEIVLQNVHLVLALLFFAVIGPKHGAAYPLSNSRLSFYHVFAKDRKTAVNIKKKTKKPTTANVC